MARVCNLRSPSLIPLKKPISPERHPGRKAGPQSRWISWGDCLAAEGAPPGVRRFVSPAAVP